MRSLAKRFECSCVPDDATAHLIAAMGTLSNDGKSFSVVVTREDGAQRTPDLYYRNLLKALSDID